MSWHRPPAALAPGLENAKGFWAIVRYEDIKLVSRTAKVFTSSQGVFLDDFPQLETILSFIVMDDPRHQALRNIMQAAFSPRNIKRMEQQIDAMAADHRRGSRRSGRATASSSSSSSQAACSPRCSSASRTCTGATC